MPHGARHRVVRPGMAHRLDELREHTAIRRLSDVLAVRPPAKVVRFLKLPRRAFEERRVLDNPCPRLRVGNEIDDVLRLRGVEPGEGLGVPGHVRANRIRELTHALERRTGHVELREALRPALR